jgi:diguanylate cyclase (GGDEF)-like protein
VGDEIFGVLTFTSTSLRPVDPAVEELLTTLGGLLAMFIDRLQRSERLQVMEDAALSDSLTGLANRRHWDQHLAAVLETGRRTADRGICVALIDLDRFKAFNDSHGHLAGDELLRQCAAAWRRCVRDVDLLARLGGDEFGVLLPACTPQEAAQVAARIRAAVPQGQGCSVGVAGWDGHSGADALVGRADQALYAAKRRGQGIVAPLPSCEWTNGS